MRHGHFPLFPEFRTRCMRIVHDVNMIKSHQAISPIFYAATVLIIYSTSFLKDYAPEPGRGAELGLRVSF